MGHDFPEKWTNFLNRPVAPTSLRLVDATSRFRNFLGNPVPYHPVPLFTIKLVFRERFRK